jgi:ribosomal protein S27E
MKIQLLSKESRRIRAGFSISCSVCGEKPAMYEVSTERQTHIMCESCKRITLQLVGFVADMGRSHS